MWLLLFPALCLVAMSAYSKTEPLATEEADAIEKGNHSLAALRRGSENEKTKEP